MKKESILVIGIICIVITGFIIYSVSAESTISAAEKNTAQTISKIDWQEYSQGLEIAKTEDKPVFLYFYAQWCTYCRKLKQTTFKDNSVRAYLQNNFISVNIDTEQKKQIARQWGITGLPTLWFLAPDNSKISSVPGYVDEEQFLHILKYIHTKSYETISFPEFVKTI